MQRNTKESNRPIIWVLIITLSLMMFSSCEVVMNALVDGISGNTGSSPTAASSANQYTPSSTSSNAVTRSTTYNSNTWNGIRRLTKCPKCKGKRKCVYCNGTGERTKHYKKNGIWYNTIDCPYCDGGGSCSECGGKGLVEAESESVSSSSSPSSSSYSPTDRNSSEKSYRTCSWCNGSGRVLKETIQNGFSLQGEKNGKCSECGAQLYKGKVHKHYNCNHCNGSGKLEN